MSPATDAPYIGGFVAAEGTFTHRRKNSSFAFAIGLGAVDAASLEFVHRVLGCGRFVYHSRRKPHYDDEMAFVVSRLADLVNVVVPFMDEHLPPSYKREQFLAWRAELFAYWDHEAKRVRPCSVDGCDQPRRAHGMCRRHLYAQRGV